MKPDAERLLREMLNRISVSLPDGVRVTVVVLVGEELSCGGNTETELTRQMLQVAEIELTRQMLQAALNGDKPGRPQ